MKTIFFFFFFLFTFIFFIEAAATIRYVSKTGSSTPPYTSWATASDSIQKCINICQNGDTVYVANGVYKEQVVMIKGLSLIGSGTDGCIIDTREQSYPGFNVITMADSSLLKGFYLLVSNNNVGTGIIITSDFDTIRCAVENNKIDNAGSGVLINNANCLVRYNQLINISYAISIGAFDPGYYPIIEWNYFSNNITNITVSVQSRPVIRNNTFYLDDPFSSAYSGGGSDTAKVFNNAAIINQAQVAYVLSGVPTIFTNNVAKGLAEWGIRFGEFNHLKNNFIEDAMVGFRSSSASALCKYNNSWNNQINYQNFTPDSSNLSVDPMIVSNSMDSLDFHLQMYSPLIDAGDPNILDVDDSRSDIGLYGGPFGESYTYHDLAPRPPRNLIAIVDTNKIILKWNRNTEADTSYYKVYRDTVINFTIDSTKLISSQSDTIYTQSIPHKVSKYVYKVTCVDIQGNESRPSEERVINLTSIRQLTDDYPMTINDYKLYPNYPNPFNSNTTIGYKLKDRGYVKLMVYDIKGELVEVLVNKEQEAGYYEAVFDAEVSSRQLAVGNESKGKITRSTGIYIYTMIVKGKNEIPVFMDTGKMIYLK